MIPQTLHYPLPNRFRLLDKLLPFQFSILEPIPHRHEFLAQILHPSGKCPRLPRSPLFPDVSYPPNIPLQMLPTDLQQPLVVFRVRTPSIHTKDPLIHLTQNLLQDFRASALGNMEIDETRRDKDPYPSAVPSRLIRIHNRLAGKGVFELLIDRLQSPRGVLQQVLRGPQRQVDSKDCLETVFQGTAREMKDACEEGTQGC